MADKMAFLGLCFQLVESRMEKDIFWGIKAE